LVAAFADDGRWPKARPDVDHGEDPHRLSLAPDNRPDLVRLKLCHGEPADFSVAETTTPAGRSFQPAMHCIPGDSLGSSDGGLVEAFDAESRHFIKSGPAGLQSMIRCPARRAECLAKDWHW
jgi:hypothetical protein